MKITASCQGLNRSAFYILQRQDEEEATLIARRIPVRERGSGYRKSSGGLILDVPSNKVIISTCLVRIALLMYVLCVVMYRRQ